MSTEHGVINSDWCRRAVVIIHVYLIINLRDTLGPPVLCLTYLHQPGQVNPPNRKNALITIAVLYLLISISQLLSVLLYIQYLLYIQTTPWKRTPGLTSRGLVLSPPAGRSPPLHVHSKWWMNRRLGGISLDLYLNPPEGICPSHLRPGYVVNISLLQFSQKRIGT